MASLSTRQKREQSLAFLEAHFGAGVPGTIAISTRKSGHVAPSTRFFQSIPEAALFACERAEQEDVYYRVTTLRQARTKGRGKDVDSLALPGLYADIDVGFRGNGIAYPPDERSAIAAIESLGLPSPELVRSGSGLHACWMLAEPVIMESKGDVRFAKAVVNRWAAHLNMRFGRSGWAIDRPGGLSKLLRVPGTQNHKNPVSCSVETVPGPLNRWPSVECLFEEAGLEIPNATGEPRETTDLGRDLPEDLRHLLRSDGIAYGLLSGSIRSHKSPSEDDFWLFVRAGRLGVDLTSHGVALLHARRASVDLGWGHHNVADYVKRTAMAAQAALNNPTATSSMTSEGRTYYRSDVVMDVYNSRHLIREQGLNITAYMVLSEMAGWTTDGVTVSIAQKVIAEKIGRDKRTVGSAIRDLIDAGWLLLMEEPRVGLATKYAFRTDPAFHVGDPNELWGEENFYPLQPMGRKKFLPSNTGVGGA